MLFSPERLSKISGISVRFTVTAASLSLLILSLSRALLHQCLALFEDVREDADYQVRGGGRRRRGQDLPAHLVHHQQIPVRIRPHGELRAGRAAPASPGQNAVERAPIRVPESSRPRVVMNWESILI